MKNVAALIEQMEEALGGNLVWISDLADQGVRQKDPETLRRLAQLDAAWKASVKWMAENKGGN